MNYNLIRQFLIVTFNEIFCKLALFLFYGTPAKYIASGNSWWLLWPKCWLETKFDCRFRLRFSWLIQLILCKCALQLQGHQGRSVHFVYEKLVLQLLSMLFFPLKLIIFKILVRFMLFSFRNASLEIKEVWISMPWSMST